MQPTHRRALAVAALCLLPLTACAGKDDEPAKADPGSQPTAPATSASPDPVEPEPTVEPTPAESTAPSEPATLADRLLATDAVPGLNAQWAWQDGTTGAAGTDPFGACAKVDLASIGATEVVQRTYFPPDDSDDNAAEQIADVPDTKTAAQINSILRTWHDKCAGQAGRKATIGPVTPVTVSNGTGAWYLVTQPTSPDETRFRAFGYVVAGKRVALLTIDSSGQDYNYPAGREPMARMVKAAADRLG